MIQFLNLFGELGGYQKILDKLSNKNGSEQPISFELASCYLEQLSNCSILFHRSFVNQYFDPLIEAVRFKLLQASEAQLRTVRKERFDEILKSLETLLLRTKSNEEKKNEIAMLHLDLALIFLRQTFLERRIDGAKFLQEVCKSAKYEVSTSYGQSLRKKVVNYIKQNKILQLLLSRDKTHIQLVQRSIETLRLLFSVGLVTDEELDLIWSVTKIDEALKLEMYKVLN